MAASVHSWRAHPVIERVPLAGSGANGEYTTFGTADDPGYNHTLDAETPRGFTYGYEYYGTFLRAMYTLFQATTGDGWAEVTGRPLTFGLYQNNGVTVSLFFVSYILLTQLVLTNVVIAVLLDSFVTTPEEKERAESSIPSQISAEAGSAFLASVGGDSRRVSVTLSPSDGDGVSSPNLGRDGTQHNSPQAQRVVFCDSNASAEVSATTPTAATACKMAVPSLHAHPEPNAIGEVAASVRVLQETVSGLQASMDALHRKMDALASTQPPAPPLAPPLAQPLAHISSNTRAGRTPESYVEQYRL